MSLDKKKLGEQELKRALLMMKYDNRKTLKENVGELEEYIIYPPSTTTSTQNEGVSDSYAAAEISGFKKERNGECWEIMILDGGRYNNIIANFCDSGYFDIKNEKYYEDETHRGKWLLNEDKTILTIIMDNGISMSGTKDTIKPQIYKLVVDKFQYSQGQSGDSFKTTFNSFKDLAAKDYNSTKVQTEPEPINKSGETKNKINKYRVCQGTSKDPFKKRCFEQDTNGPIHKVQTCLGVVSDGKFWVKTETALYNKTKKTSFTNDEVDSICGTVQTSPEVPTPTVELPTPDAEDNIDSINV
jgi:hypothetical protein